MKLDEINKEASEIKDILKESYNGNVKISVDGYSFDVDNVSDYGGGILINSNSRFPKYSYRFTYLMFEIETDKLRGITHRTFCEESDKYVIENREKFIPQWEDTKYELIRIEKIIDDQSQIYKKIWEMS